MACAGQEERIVADLYGELPHDEREEFARHLAACETCRCERQELEAVRSYVQEARPAVPATPRVVVLRPRPARLPSLAIAASLAAVGMLAGVALSWSYQAKRATELAAQAGATGAANVDLALLPTRSQLEEIMDAKLAQFRDEQQRAAERTVAQPALLTRSELDDRLSRMERKIDRTRSDDVRYLLGEMEGVENRTGMRLGQTQEAIRYLALASDPRISER